MLTACSMQPSEEVLACAKRAMMELEGHVIWLLSVNHQLTVGTTRFAVKEFATATRDTSGTIQICKVVLCFKIPLLKDSHFRCVPVGSCNGAYCAENAYCRYDERLRVNYCHCPEGYVGDGVSECKSVPPPCNVRNNCGLYASCSPNYRWTFQVDLKSKF